ncbi:MAG: GDSL-type esterase/lipase family protein [Verrucomicrobiota bacterium]
MLLFIQNKYYRAITTEQLTVKISNYRSPEWVFMGNGITAGGRNWSLRFGLNPFNSINLGHIGYSFRQIAAQIPKAVSYHSKYLVLTAETTDLMDVESDAETFNFKEWENLVTQLPNNPHCLKIICSIPPQRDPSTDSRINALNEKLKTQAESYQLKFLDLNPILLESNVSRPSLFIDSIHLSDTAYDLWAHALLNFTKEYK